MTLTERSPYRYQVSTRLLAATNEGWAAKPWLFRTAWRPWKGPPTNRAEACDCYDWLVQQLGPDELQRRIRAHIARAPTGVRQRIEAGIAQHLRGKKPMPMAERMAIAREMQRQLDAWSPPQRAKAPSRTPTTEENWRAAGRRLTGAEWRQWDRINQRIDGIGAMLLDLDDKRFLVVMRATGGIDPDRRR